MTVADPTTASFVYDDSVDTMTVHTLFDVLEGEVLDRDRLVRLAAGVAGAVRVRGFFTPHECAAVAAAVEHQELGRYDFDPPIAKLGPAAYDHYKSGGLDEDYFERAARDAAVRSRLLDGADPLAVALERLRAAWGGPVEPATAGGRPLYAGLIREINAGALLHFDEVSRECPTALDDQPVAQLAFNCHLTMPECGGDVRVVRRRWLATDETHRDGYGYAEHLAAGQPAVRLRPEVGDAVLFDPRHFHSVTPVTGGRRITLSFFLGVHADGRLTVWA
jgi:hypothetical protein